MMQANPSSKRHAAAVAFYHLSRVGLGLVFLWSGLLKIRQPYEFLANVYDYELVGPEFGRWVAILLPWTEVILGVCLLGGLLVAGSFIVSSVLGVIFVGVQWSAIHRELGISCGCFGNVTAQHTVSYSTLLRTGVMLLVAIAGYVAWLRAQAATARSAAAATPDARGASVDHAPLAIPSAAHPGTSS